MAEPEAEPGQWLSHAEAALRLGWKQGRVIAARRQGRLQGRKGNSGQWLVRMPELVAGAAQGEAGALAELREEVAELRVVNRTPFRPDRGRSRQGIGVRL